ncbi:uncharacterized protein LOC124265659 [Haliotis rubra]|uniref:uncharacterized protein LOC124265659 n=1 Tax=Haliotis rubra TaxID=36100 RepID=UPI001EE544FD|nr:uncharacterized protein LOC124265659 [Haliotis rubra]XP_046556413.1 uncharacterized protein LOC124265659 [Haliotis rubra]
MKTLTPLTLLAFLWLSRKVTGFSQSFFVRISDTDRSFTSGTVIGTMNVPSRSNCITECLRIGSCLAVNIGPEADNAVTCDLLSDIPVSPMRNLTVTPGIDYFEKTCQTMFYPTMATVYLTEGYKVVQNSILIDDNRGRTYVFNLSDTYETSSLEYESTGSSSDQRQSMAGIILADGVREVSVIDGMVRCLHHPYSDSPPTPCSGLKPVTSIFGTDDINALLQRYDGNVLLGFGHSQVTMVNVTLNETWPVVGTIDLSPGNQTPGWTDIPRGVVAAAWFVKQPNSFSTAILITRHYYVVYDFVNDAILKRGHLCPVIVS